MAELKTRQTSDSVAAFLDGVTPDARRTDCRAVAALMQRITGAPPRMWGSSIVGFGSYHYKYASGREGDWFLAGFAPRKQDLTLYVVAGLDRHQDLMARLGTYRTGRSCLYVRRLADIDRDVLGELLERSVASLRAGAP